MKGAGVCSLNREVHYIMWSLNRVSGVCTNVVLGFVIWIWLNESLGLKSFEVRFFQDFWISEFGKSLNLL